MIGKVVMGMRMPPGIMGAALVFWGLMAEHVVIAVLMALILEGHWLLKARWELSELLLTRIWTLSAIGFFFTPAMAVYQGEGAQMIYRVLEWMPVIAFPLVAAQAYSTRGGVPTSVLSLVARRAKKDREREGEVPRPPQLVDVQFLYFAFSICAASVANLEGWFYYVAVGVFMLWGVWSNPDRPRRRLKVLLPCFLVVMAMGYGGSVGLHALHLFLENTAMQFDNGGGDTDPDLAQTRIGSVGELKLSPAIIWRVKQVSGLAPMYLRSASYNWYRHNTWYTREYVSRPAAPGSPEALAKGSGATTGQAYRARFRTVDRAEGDEGEFWDMNPGPLGPQMTGRLVMRKVKGRGSDRMTLPMPDTPLGVWGMDDFWISRNVLRAVKAEEIDGGLLSYSVKYVHGLRDEWAPQVTEPSRFDLQVPKYEKLRGLDRVTQSLGLDTMEPREVIDRLYAFFGKEFTYSTYLTDTSRHLPPRTTVLANFLENERSGHCEYFATATVMLLRNAGVPARYVTGFGLSEMDSQEEEYIVRGMHAHAWVQVYVEGQWEYMDTTPATWAEEDSHVLAWVQPLMDWVQGLPVRLEDWSVTPVGAAVILVFKWVSIPGLMIWLWWRLFKGQRGRRVRQDEEAFHILPLGTDSEFFQLEKSLAEYSEERHVGECVRDWWARVEARVPDDLRPGVAEAIELHYRHRFDPSGLMVDERARLGVVVSECMERCLAEE